MLGTCLRPYCVSQESFEKLTISCTKRVTEFDKLQASTALTRIEFQPIFAFYFYFSETSLSSTSIHRLTTNYFETRSHYWRFDFNGCFQWDCVQIDGIRTDMCSKMKVEKFNFHNAVRTLWKQVCQSLSSIIALKRSTTEAGQVQTSVTQFVIES